jgi:UDP-glucose 4-epimerase
VLEIVNTFKEVTGRDVPYQITGRRDGDLPAFWADSQKANSVLGWTCRRNLSSMMQDTWNWQSKNPHGYEK